MDLQGPLLGHSLQGSQSLCQAACCSLPSCLGYSFGQGAILSGAPSALCYTFANITQLIPNNNQASGILSSS